jgi:cytoskeletal protein RodZ
MQESNQRLERRLISELVIREGGVMTQHINETDTTPTTPSTNPKWEYLYNNLKSTARKADSRSLKWYSSQSTDGDAATTNEFPVIVLEIVSSDQEVRLVGNEKSEATLRDIQSKLTAAKFYDLEYGRYDYSKLTEDQVVTALNSITPLIV